MDQAFAELQRVTDRVWPNLAQAASTQGYQRFMFVSTEAGAGTSVMATSTALGVTLNLRESVCLVEIGTARPSVASYLGLPQTPGMSDVLDGRAPLEKALTEVAEHPGLSVLSGGSPRPAVRGELASESGRSLLGELSRRSKFLFFDCPPLLEHPETRVLLEYVDAAVLVLRARSTRKDTAQRALETLESAGIPVVGSILNRFRSDVPFQRDVE